MSDLSKKLMEETSQLEIKMKIAGISKREFLKRADIHFQTWGNWRRGEGNPTFRKFEKAKDTLEEMISEAE